MARTASFSALHLQRLQVRAIDPQLAYDEGARSLDEAEVRKALGCPRAAGGGLCYSYGFIGAPDTPFTEYNRVHLDDPAANGARKALVPAKRTPPPYFLTTADEGHLIWFVTESPEKALAIKSAGISEPIGLGGVDAGFLAKKEEGKPRRLQSLVTRFVKPGHLVYVPVPRTTFFAVAHAPASARRWQTNASGAPPAPGMNGLKLSRSGRPAA